MHIATELNCIPGVRKPVTVYEGGQVICVCKSTQCDSAWPADPSSGRSGCTAAARRCWPTRGGPARCRRTLPGPSDECGGPRHAAAAAHCDPAPRPLLPLPSLQQCHCIQASTATVCTQSAHRAFCGTDCAPNSLQRIVTRHFMQVTTVDISVQA